jgi:polyhydroxybutyrate depolymerase
MNPITKILRRSVFIYTFIILAIATAFAGDINGSMSYGGKNRTYLLHIPTGYNAASPTPLVFVFHGLTGTGSMMADITKFSPLADQENFIVVYPDGISKKWASPGGNIDDVGFINALIDALSSSYNIDADRIFATGASNGGMFTYRLGIELTDRFAAIADVAGFLPNYSSPVPVPSKQIPVIHFHGTADAIIPFSAAENAVNYWVDFNSCNAAPSTIQLPNVDAGDGTTVDKLTYANGINNSDVALYKVYSGGHTWPGTSSNAMPGKVTKDIIASEIIWEFFKSAVPSSNAAPTVSFTKPAMGVEFIAPASIVIKATAIDADGTIKNVKFFNGSIILKTDPTVQYSYTWNNVPAGVYTIIAEASDDQDAKSSDTVIITVNPPKTAFEYAPDNLVAVAFNPSYQQLIINKMDDQVSYDLLLFDAVGRLVFSAQQINDSQKIISTNELNGGMYLYTIKMNQGNLVTGKFIVTN